MTMNRRVFMQGVGLAAGVAATAPLTRFAAATSPPVKVAGQQVPGIYRTQVGSIEVAAILDGGMELGLDLFKVSSVAAAESLQQEAFQSPGPVKAYVNTFVINTGKKLILVDTGAASMAPTLGKLQQNLQAAGYAAADFSEIYLTHGHIDHVSGLVDAAGKAVFPQAQIRIHETELQHWYDDAAQAQAPEGAKGLFAAARKALDPYKTAGQIKTFKASEDLGQGVHVVDLAGHTPGHSGFRVTDGTDQLVLWGDIVHAPVLQFRHPDWSVAFDVDAAKALETRNKILAEVTADRVRVAGAHHVFPAFGNIAKAAEGYAFVPQVWEI